MKTIDIKGKQYVQVHERILYFRANFEEWSLTSDLVDNSDGSCIFKAYIHDGTGTLRATGYAREKDGDSYINKTSYIENCETSAWGRALANLGIGIETSVASADEVQNAVIRQENPAPQAKPKEAATEKKPSLKIQFLVAMVKKSEGKLAFGDKKKNIKGTPNEVFLGVTSDICNDDRIEELCNAAKPKVEYPLTPNMPDENDGGWDVLINALEAFDLDKSIKTHKTAYAYNAGQKKGKGKDADA